VRSVPRVAAGERIGDAAEAVASAHGWRAQSVRRLWYSLGTLAGMTSKRALITGCSTGIGRATAAELHARGYEVIATARRPETIEDLEVAGRLALDVDSDASVANVVAEAGPIDVLVNNAGFGVEGLDRDRAPR
jgi:NADPH:quinone reductase-like Zn-dependent oxidoreductase